MHWFSFSLKHSVPPLFILFFSPQDCFLIHVEKLRLHTAAIDCIRELDNWREAFIIEAKHLDRPLVVAAVWVMNPSSSSISGGPWANLELKINFCQRWFLALEGVWSGKMEHSNILDI